MAFYELTRGAANPLAARWRVQAGLRVIYILGRGGTEGQHTGAKRNFKLLHCWFLGLPV